MQPIVCDKEQCINKFSKCNKCDGDLYYRMVKEKPPQQYQKKSKRGGSALERETVKLRPNSGATRFAKGDCMSPNLLIECKHTDKASIHITKDWLDTIDKESKDEEYRLPVLNFQIGAGQVYSIVKYTDLLSLVENQKE